MVRGAVIGFVLGLAATGAFAQAAGEAIRGVISDQIEAFKSRRLHHRLRFRLAGDQAPVRLPRPFGAMVRDGYPMVWRPESLRFTDLREEGGRTVQSVIVTDQAGALFVLDYEMVPGGGGWQINGVTVRQTGAETGA